MLDSIYHMILSLLEVSFLTLKRYIFFSMNVKTFPENILTTIIA